MFRGARRCLPVTQQQGVRTGWLSRSLTSHDPPIYTVEGLSEEEVKIIVTQEIEKQARGKLPPPPKAPFHIQYWFGFLGANSSWESKGDKGSVFPEYERWSERLASNSEAIVKAERSLDKSIEELQQEAIQFSHTPRSDPIPSAPNIIKDREEEELLKKRKVV